MGVWDVPAVFLPTSYIVPIQRAGATIVAATTWTPQRTPRSRTRKRTLLAPSATPGNSRSSRARKVETCRCLACVAARKCSTLPGAAR